MSLLLPLARGDDPAEPNAGERRAAEALLDGAAAAERREDGEEVEVDAR